MARKYRIVPGVGRCTVGLRGVPCDGRSRALLARKEPGGELVVILGNPNESAEIQVTAMEPESLLRRLSAFRWEYAFDTETESR